MTDDFGSGSGNGGGQGGGLIYGLEFQCRALSAVEAENERIIFLVGTQSLKATNQVHAVELDDDSRTISKVVYSHPAGEVWDLASSPQDPDLFISRHSLVDAGGTKCSVGATLWSRRDDHDDEGGDAIGDFNLEGGAMRRLRAVCKVDGGENSDGSICDVSHVSFAPGQGSRVMTLSENRLELHDISELDGGRSKVVAKGRLEGKGQTNLTHGAWNPHQNSQTYAAVNDHVIRAWDIRTMEQVWSLETPGHQAVRSIDFNPNKQYQLATAGDDGCVRYWDVRQTGKALVTRMDHSHWVWCVRFNQFHDQLVLSASSDCHVILTCVASISSEPCGHLVDEDDEDAGRSEERVLEDGVLKTYDDHEESVYVAAWSSADPWTFASLSYDGRLVINRVQREVKFKILNLV